MSDFLKTSFFYQKVYPPDPDPFRKPPFFWEVTTVFPCDAAICAAFGAHPGGGGGIDAGAYGVNRAPASNCPLPTGGAACGYAALGP